MLDLVINNARLYPMTEGLMASPARSIGIRDGVIVSLESKTQSSAKTVIDARNQLVMPGFIDCHTHLVYSGNRKDEYFKRLAGVAYEDIARQGGGILNTVEAVGRSSEKELIHAAKKRVFALEQEGVTTIEVKSGYGLDVANELKMLRVINALDAQTHAQLVPTFLGAHAVPPDQTASEYIDQVIHEMLPQVAENKLACSVDIFVENIAFTVSQMERVFHAAKAAGLGTRAHIDQLSHSGGAARAAELGALSLDHVEYLDQTGIDAMAKNDTVAVLLPGAFYFLKETTVPPVAKMRAAGVPMAVATDLNPGSAPIASLLLNIHLACNRFAMTPEEALLGVTKNAAKALGRDRIGTVAKGQQADLTMWELENPETLAYEYGCHHPTRVIKSGKLLDLGYTRP